LNNTSTRYAQFNALTVTGRIFNAEIVDNKGNKFLSVSVISTASKDGVDLVYTFNNSNGLMSLFEKGYFCKGRQVTITGHISNVSEVYTTRTGEVTLRKRPEIHLTGVTVLDGGLGPMPNAEGQAQRLAAGTVITQVGTPAVDATPSMEPVEVEEEEELVALY
jgi:hypothetical protein